MMIANITNMAKQILILIVRLNGLDKCFCFGRHGFEPILREKTMITDLLRDLKADFYVQHGDVNLYYATGVRIVGGYYVVGSEKEILIVPDMEKNRA